MKNDRWLTAFVILVLATLACQTITGGGVNPTDVVIPTSPTTGNDNLNSNESLNENSNDSGGAEDGTSDAGFPLPPDATSVTDMGPDLVTFQTEMSLEEVMAFYRDVLGKEGYTERVDLTVTAGPTFSMVFDGHESGKALAVQAVEFAGSVTVTLSLQDI